MLRGCFGGIWSKLLVMTGSLWIGEGGIKVEAGCAGRAGSALGISLRWSMIVKVKVILGVDFVFEASVTE
jgi:hypothetical protein